MSRIGLAAHAIAIESSAEQVQFGGNINLTPENFLVSNVSGLAATPDFNFDLSLDVSIPRKITLSDIAPAIGEWTAIAESKSAGIEGQEYVVCNDEFGYSPIFYSIIPGKKLVVSDSFQGVAYELMRAGIKSTLNVNSYITTLLTKDARFANPLASQTASNEIQLLPPHKAIHVSGNHVNVFDRALLLEIESSNFESNIEEGINYITGVMNQLAANESTSRSLLLSGGVDSRVVLALVLAAGKEKDFNLRSNDPRLYKSKYSYRVFEDDFFISHAIGKHFGMSWLPTRSANNVKTSLHEGLRISQSTSSNFSNAFPATSHHPVFTNPEISLRGGGGEPLKGAGFLSLIKQVKEFSARKGTHKESPFGQFKRWYLSNALVDQSKAGQIGDTLEEIKPWLNTDSFDELMPSYYQHSRNRTHFGHAKFSRFTNLFPFQPLSNSFFFTASQQHENIDLRDNKIARRIFELTAPSLLDFPFEDEEATKSLTNGAVKTIQKNPDTLDSHFRKLAEYKPTIQGHQFSGSTSESFLKDKNAALFSMCRNLASDIEDAFSEHRKELKQVHKSVFDAIENGIMAPTLAVARMMSARDTFMPMSQPGITIKYSTHVPEGQSLQISGLSSSDLLPSLKTPNFSIKPPVVLSPSTQIDGNKVEVNAGPESTRPTSLEFAFYLLQDEVAIQRSSYSLSSTIEFDIPEKANKAELSVKCYARHQGSVAPCVIMTVQI
ncbi:MAG: hypothetical protein ACTJGF_03060 [Corynebacterium sp.]